MFGCEHPTIAYEVAHRLVLPFRWAVHTLRCTLCDTQAVLVNRERVSK